jgi:hypothetical protein
MTLQNIKKEMLFAVYKSGSNWGGEFVEHYHGQP